MPLLAGTRIGPYEIVAPLGHGGMGEVYRATDTHLGRAAAIKVLPETFALDAERIARFFLRRPQFEVLELTYTDVLNGPRPQAQRLADFLGSPMDVEKMAQVVDRQLYRNRST